VILRLLRQCLIFSWCRAVDQGQTYGQSPQVRKQYITGEGTAL